MTANGQGARQRVLDDVTPDNVRFLALRVRYLHRTKRLKDAGKAITENALKTKMAKALKYTPSEERLLDKKWSQWMRGQASALGKEEYAFLVGFLFDNGLWVEPALMASMERFYPDAPFHALAQFFAMTPAQVEEDRSLFVGTYNAYCFIQSVPRNIAVGRLTIGFDADSGALTTLEEYDLTPVGGPKGPRHVYDGYLVRAARSHRIFARDRYERPAGAAAEAQLILLRPGQPTGGKVLRIDGTILHCNYGGGFYVNRVVFRRIGDGAKPEVMRIVPYPKGKPRGEAADPALADIVSVLTKPLNTEVDFIWQI